ncbi:MAG TPA: hypothetical protein VK335_08485 [Bryobacteraceae bacterium]|nr:hypothetical protein [Bryobacteraceae bacterium]HXR15943.1 hypothetical protein [Terriglobales bacterium]HZW96151.1 hypothetical protein [Candidatus Eremiobacteraceae bacterium]
MIRWANYKEAVSWLKANAHGPTGFYLWGSIYVRRAVWDGSTWRWLTDDEQRDAAGVSNG